MEKDSFQIGDVEVGLGGPLFAIAGPCVIENEKMCLEIARELVRIGRAVGVGIIFKASFDKANRTSISSFRGPGLAGGLEVLTRVRDETGLALTTDVHERAQAEEAARVVDCLQVPAFLCRQTDLLTTCAQTGKAVNVKKGQFMSPQEMKNVVEKIRAHNNKKIVLTERGTFFGYNRLINDMTAIGAMKNLGCPVVFDATHSTQHPGGRVTESDGQREMAPVLAKAAIAAGANGLFIEVHPRPEESKSDSACIMPLEWLEGVLNACKKIFEIVRTD